MNSAMLRIYLLLGNIDCRATVAMGSLPLENKCMKSCWIIGIRRF